MSDVIKAAQADAAKVQAAAGEATASAVADEKVAQGFLRRNIWAVVGVAVAAVVILVAVVVR